MRQNFFDSTVYLKINFQSFRILKFLKTRLDIGSWIRKNIQIRIRHPEENIQIQIRHPDKNIQIRIRHPDKNILTTGNHNMCTRNSTLRIWRAINTFSVKYELITARSKTILIYIDTICIPTTQCEDSLRIYKLLNNLQLERRHCSLQSWARDNF